MFNRKILGVLMISGIAVSVGNLFSSSFLRPLRTPEGESRLPAARGIHDDQKSKRTVANPNNRPWHGRKKATLAEHYGLSEVVERMIQVPLPDGKMKRIQLLNTSFRYPNIRVEEVLVRDPGTGELLAESRKEMVADHVLVELAPGSSMADLADYTETNGFEIRGRVGRSRNFLIAFSGDTLHDFEKSLAQLRESPVINLAEPDYILRL